MVVQRVSNTPCVGVGIITHRFSHAGGYSPKGNRYRSKAPDREHENDEDVSGRLDACREWADRISRLLALGGLRWLKALGMFSFVARRRGTATKRSLIGLLMVLLTLTVSLLAVSGMAHRALHPDHGMPGHACAFTMIAKAHLIGQTGNPVAGDPSPCFLMHQPVHATVPAAPRDLRSPPSCGPPTLPS